jgi:hypothetical protein
MQTNPFIGLSFDRLRFEYERRERKVREIEEEERRELKIHYNAIKLCKTVRQEYSLADMHRENEDKLSNQKQQLHDEMKQVEAAMDLL